MLKIEGDSFRYQLNWIENIGAFWRDPKSRISNLVSVTAHENPWTIQVLRGIRAPGTGFPFVIMLGTMWHRKGRDFCVVYRRKPVLLLEFKDESFKRWVIPDNEANRSVLRTANPGIDLPASAL
ncbi:MAG: hypothetical protein EBV95_04605 [Actinobacteria bacterium]|nr:hypothetical protein [Actinomycetota bacterium]